MFADCMLETSWAQRSHRGWTTLSSFGLEALAIGLLLLVPLWKTVGLPTGRSLPTPVTWGAPAAPAPPMHRQRATTVVQSNLADNRLVAPREVPDHVAHIEETVPPPQVNFNTDCVEGCITSGSRIGVLGAINEALRNVAPPPSPAPKPVAHTFRPSSLLEGSLIQRVLPVYPPLARTARIQGPVVLFAVISKAGTIENLRIVSGQPMLVKAAIDAVSQWRYRPYILNNEPVEVETQITVVFTLN